MPILPSPHSLRLSFQESWYEQYAERLYSLIKERAAERARRRAAAPSFKVIESVKLRAKVAYEVRNWCLRFKYAHVGDDLIQDALVYLMQQLPDYRPGVQSVETWVLAKPHGLLYGFLNNYGRSRGFKKDKKTKSAEASSRESDEFSKALTVGEIAEIEHARKEEAGADKRALTDATQLLRGLVLQGKLSRRSADVWLYRHGWSDDGNQQSHDTAAKHFGLTSANVRQIVRRASDAIRSELKAMGLRARSGRSLEPGPRTDRRNKDRKRTDRLSLEKDRHDEWERHRAESWREFHANYEDCKKNVA